MTMVTLALLSSASEIAPPDAVNGPILAAVAGTVMVTPLGGTGLGMGTLKLSVPEGIDPGVAPVASIVVLAVPVRAVFPSAAAADTIVAGMGTDV